MLVATCYHVSLKLEDGRRVRPPGACLHDNTGTEWPRGSVLIAPFKKTGEPLDHAGREAEQWSTIAGKPRRGQLPAPPKSLSQWSFVGAVAAIDYERYGEHADKYRHEFDGEGERGGDAPWSKMLFLEIAAPQPVLYRYRSIYRMELPDGFVFNWRGFVWP
jgi:hypothetical protein